MEAREWLRDEKKKNKRFPIVSTCRLLRDSLYVVRFTKKGKADKEIIKSRLVPNLIRERRRYDSYQSYLKFVIDNSLLIGNL